MHKYDTMEECTARKKPVVSYGIINVNFPMDSPESLVIKNKFTHPSKPYQITSLHYPKVKCTILENNRLDQYTLQNETISCQNINDIAKFYQYKNCILFMMVSRKYSLGFVQFIRGKYDLTHPQSIVVLFNQMYPKEIEMIANNTYDQLYSYFVCKELPFTTSQIESKHFVEYHQARSKFELLKTNIDPEHNLDYYVQYVKPLWINPEWGFPKGRKFKRTEKDLSCACREFEEETGYRHHQYQVLNKIEPISEKLIGTNGLAYKHVYYLAVNNNYQLPLINECDRLEIGDIKWFTYEEAMQSIRPYHLDKKRILTQIYLFFMNYLVCNECNLMTILK